jgi:fused signal recognition particle receptor
MNELSKMRRVLSKEVEGAPHEVMLVIDATTGQNGVLQASSFAGATGVDSIILTKMDGTSKGGIILSIREELGIPVKFVGYGETVDDLMEFDLENYIYGLCSTMEE